jgi:CRISPR-associated protein Cas5t
VERFWLHARAPFAAYRAMQAGVYRTTLPVIPHSAALGLVLNLAGIETRDPEPEVTTQVRADIPRLRIAIGALASPGVSTLYQQLHSYPVGASGKELKERSHGAKYWIAPVRRELLVGLDAIIGVEAPKGALRDRVRRGLDGQLAEERYGLPFAGDNNLLFDRLDLLDAPPPARWYTRILAGDPPRRGSCRLTVGIDRRDSSRTTTVLCAPMDQVTSEPPEAAWVWTPRGLEES